MLDTVRAKKMKTLSKLVTIYTSFASTPLKHNQDRNPCINDLTVSMFSSACIVSTFTPNIVTTDHHFYLLIN